MRHEVCRLAASMVDGVWGEVRHMCAAAECNQTCRDVEPLRMGQMRSPGRLLEPSRGLASCQHITLTTLPDCQHLQEVINCTVASRKEGIVTLSRL